MLPHVQAQNWDHLLLCHLLQGVVLQQKNRDRPLTSALTAKLDKPPARLPLDPLPPFKRFTCTAIGMSLTII
jgi:hypothetical protein